MEWMEVVDVINKKTEDFENCIYLWRNKVNQKMYVGQAKNFRKRTREHKNEAFNKKSKAYKYSLHKAIRKYGIENFEICILEFDLNDYVEMGKKETEMGEKEDFYIKKYDTLAKNQKGYNEANGGRSGNKYAGKTPEEMKGISKKLSEARSGENHPRCRKIICITNGEIFDYTKQAGEKYGVNPSQITACCKGKRNSTGVIDGKPAMWMYYSDYKKLSEEEIVKIKNQELPNKGRPKAVICITTGKIYDSAAEAERQTGVDHRCVSKCCNEKYKSTGKDEYGNKLVWMFLEDYQKLTQEEVNKIKNQELSDRGRPKAVICITTGKIYDSAHEAERQIGVSHSNIISNCRGRYKSAGKDENGNKLVWMYLDEYLESLK